MMDFSGGAGVASNFDLIPQGQLAWAYVTVRGVKPSKSGGQYLDLELTLDDGQPFARRKVFDKVGDPQHPGNSETYKQMGLIAVTRMLEAGNGAGPNNPAGYQIQNYGQLSGKRVAIKIGIEKGGEGYDDKNRVAEYLTPNPQSQSGHKGYQELMAGNHGAYAKKGAAAQPASGFGGGSAQQQQGGGGFGNQPSSSNINQSNQTVNPSEPGGSTNQGGQASFSQAQPQGQNQWGNQSASTAGSQSTISSAQGQSSVQTATSHSDPAATPGWMQQANASGQ